MKRSYHMEKEGLVKSLRMMKRKKFKIDTLVTDHHKQITKWMSKM